MAEKNKVLCDHCGENKAVIKLCQPCTDRLVSKATEGKEEEREEKEERETTRGACERCGDNPAIMGLCQSCINDLASTTLRPEKEVRRKLDESVSKKENLDVRSNIMRKTAIQKEIDTLKWVLNESDELD